MAPQLNQRLAPTSDGDRCFEHQTLAPGFLGGQGLRLIMISPRLRTGRSAKAGGLVQLLGRPTGNHDFERRAVPPRYRPSWRHAPLTRPQTVCSVHSCRQSKRWTGRSCGLRRYPPPAPRDRALRGQVSGAAGANRQDRTAAITLCGVARRLGPAAFGGPCRPTGLRGGSELARIGSEDANPGWP
jgi:hypothetical protein